MKIIKKIFNKCYILENLHFKDKRGYFTEHVNTNFEVFKKQKFIIKQVNLASSKPYVFRGFHYQVKKPQAKLVACIEGEIYDIIVDLNKNSQTYMKHATIKLKAEDKKLIFIPKGFAHGYYTKSKHAKMVYYCDEYYFKKGDRVLNFQNPLLKFNLPKFNFLISKKDISG